MSDPIREQLEPAEETPLQEAAAPRPDDEMPAPAAEEAAEPVDAPAEVPDAPAVQETAPAQEAPAGAPAAPHEGLQRHWDRILTGSADTLPEDVRRRAGADDPSRPEDEREYRLLGTVNRSWAADCLGVARRQVSSRWREIRSSMADALEVADDEGEVFSALSDQRARARQDAAAQQAFRAGYADGLAGRSGGGDDGGDDIGAAALAAVREQGRLQGERERAPYRAVLPDITKGLDFIRAAGEGGMEHVHMWLEAPELVSALDYLQQLDPAERARVYRLAAAGLPAAEEHGLAGSAVQAFKRSAANVSLGLVQGVGNVAAAAGHALARGLGWESAGNAAAGLDRRLQVLEEMRGVVQGELYPVEPPAESGLAGQMLVDAAAATPGAGLAFCGGTGFGLLMGSGVGEAIAEARQRAPQGDQQLQTAAGLLGGTIQAGIYVGMGKMGSALLSRSIDRFVRARGGTQYAWAGLKGLGDVGAETAKLLLAGKAAQAAELGTQELAARVDGTASNIDWRAYGDNLVDIEANMREAAALLPFLLIASGRAGLHHFRSPRAVLGDGRALREDWGLDDSQMERLENAGTVRERSALLREFLSGSKRWGAPGFMPEVMRAMRLLNTDYYQGFKDEAVVRDFLSLPSETDMARRPDTTPADTENPAAVAEMREHIIPDRKLTLSRQQLPYLQLLDGWWKNAHFDTDAVTLHPEEPPPADAVETGMVRSAFYLEDAAYRAQPVPERAQRNGFYLPAGPEESAALMRDRTAELRDISYRYLLNSFSLDTLGASFKSPALAAKVTEEARRKLVGSLCSRVLDCAAGTDPETVMDDVAMDLVSTYRERSGRRYAPRWLRDLPAKELSTLLNVHESGYGALSHTHREPVRRLMELNLGLRSCARTLYGVLPHTDDFQTALSRGCTVPQAYALLLKRELGADLPEDWGADVLAGMQENPAPNAGNMRLFERYQQLTGRGLVSATGDDGNQYWRIMRPDGRYTRWHAHDFQAVNDLVSNSLLQFLPAGGDALADRLARNPAGLQDVAAMAAEGNAGFSGYDQLCSTAMHDLGRCWMESASMYPVGMDVARVRHRLRGAEGTDGITPLGREGAAEGDTTYDMWSMATPLALLQGRFLTYWERQLRSRALDAQEAADFLVSNRLMVPEEAESLLTLSPRDPFEQSYVPGRRVLPAKTNAALAEGLARFSTGYVLSRLDSVPLPASVKNWIALAPFCEPLPAPERPKTVSGSRLTVPIGRNGRGLVRWANRRTAEKIRGMQPLLGMVDAALQAPEEGQGHIMELVRASVMPTETQRLEQAWCHSLAGKAAFRGAGQDLRNLLENPARGWENLWPEDRLDLCRTLLPDQAAGLQENFLPADLLAQQPVQEMERAVQELDSVLRDFPGLRAYTLNPDHGGRLDRLVLSPALQEMPELDMQPGRLYVAGPMQADYTLERGCSLPQEWRQDPRVLPALTLLGKLRAYAANKPGADASGIWWNNRLYGGLNGRTPEGIPAGWKPELPFAGVAEFLQAWEQGPSPLCSGLLKPLHAPLQPELMQCATLYRNPAQPDNIFRLMPGDSDSANPHARVPYIVHTFKGSPTVGGRLLYDEKRADEAYQPLEKFAVARRTAFGSQRQDNLHDLQLYRLGESFLERSESVESMLSGSLQQLTNRELLMRLGVDTRFCEQLAALDPQELTRGQGAAAALVRGLMGMEFSDDPAAYAADLVALGNRLRQEPDLLADMYKILQESSGRVGVWRAVTKPTVHRRKFEHRKSDERKVRRVQPGAAVVLGEDMMAEIRERMKSALRGDYSFLDNSPIEPVVPKEDFQAEERMQEKAAERWARKQQRRLDFWDNNGKEGGE